MNHAGGGATATSSLRYVGVSVATLWASPSAPRKIDRAALGNPVDMRAWTRVLNTTARLGLVGRVETQALFGEPVRILAQRGSWTRIAVVDQPTPRDRQGYPGWVPSRQLSASTSFGRLLTGRIAVVTRPTTWLHGELGPLELSFGTRLPVVGVSGGNVIVATPPGPTARLPSSDVGMYRSAGAISLPSGPELVATARMFLGVRYLWGGASAFGLDCSGLMNLIYRARGLVIPRDADPQALAGRLVTQRALQPGDLVFFATEPPSRAITHVAMGVGDGRILESPNSAGAVHIIPLAARGDERVTARRYLPPEKTSRAAERR